MAKQKNSTQRFGAEKKIFEDLDRARAMQEWSTLASILQNLVIIKQKQLKLARNGKRVRLIDCMELVENIKEGGRFLVKPPLVGRDASIIGNIFSSSGIPSIVICREPKTKSGRCPVVSLGSGVTVRIQVDEPSNPDKPTCEWFDKVVDELGNQIVDRIDDFSSSQRQLDYLLAHLSAVPMHVSTYKAAIALCKTLQSENV